MNKTLIDLFLEGRVAVFEDGSEDHRKFLQALENMGCRWRNGDLPTRLFHNTPEFLMLKLDNGLARGRIHDIKNFYPDVEFYSASEMMHGFDFSDIDTILQE